MQDATEDKSNIIKPNFHFKTGLIQVGEDDNSNKIAVSELVKADTLLASFKNFHIYEKDGYEKAPLEPGENCKFAEDETSIISAVAGYPRITTKKVKDVTEPLTLISIEPLIVIPPDEMKAVISLHPQIKEATALTIGVIEEIIADLGIEYGLHESAMEKINQIIVNNENEFNKIKFATGTPVGKSYDSYLRFDMEVGPIAGTFLDDGTLDFRDRRIMVGVKEGECIATKIPVIVGDPGINIFGHETPARTPVDIKVQPLNDAKFIPETNQVMATNSGVLSIVNGNVIKVLSHQVISGDVDYSTGNIDSKNCVTIQGNVQPGFKVQTIGDLEIGQGVMSAKVTCDANLVIKGGITGKKNKIVATGDCDINFIEQGTLNCGGLCVIRKQSYYSDITADGDIRCKPGTKVMGGKIYSGGDITLFDVGADNSSPSLIAAGVVPQRLQQFEELKQSIVDLEQEVVQWLQRYKGSSSSKKIKNMEKEITEKKLQRIRFNLIPGTGIYSRAAGPDDLLEDDAEEYNADGGIDIDQITIDVYGTIRRDNIIRIGNRELRLEKTVTHRQFKLHPNGKRIIAVPLKK